MRHSGVEILCILVTLCLLLMTVTDYRGAPVFLSLCVSYRKSLDLVDILLQLADEGFQTLVLELFKFPMQYCPDLLLLGLLQIVQILFLVIIR